LDGTITMFITKRAPVRATAAVLLALGLAGCATISDSNQQVVAVQTILDSREVAGAGCVLTNEAGRWFVTSPGRVTITKSHSPLYVDCRRGQAIMGQDVAMSKASTAAVVGNAVLTAGIGYLIDKRSGAGFDYPSTLTVMLVRTSDQPERQSSDAVPGSGLY
jgi:hypothetical protein